ncbi:oxygen-insensitive NADPH nitroreductase [Salibacterium salarium]|uniref:Oxygen-insensitive NADPH nitroreductase n=1 Tax=Salibacterium salarium TaxID=284579 RepID=A0A428MZ62_9BACI|nr:oxygen-insensitive NADPH nitroreductase [Salibacterium salarium]RSL31443.1 oxygen-insensitive NADPH nitroreductase [Salibacterium salarium]
MEHKNETKAVIQNHRSIRKFTDDAVPDEILKNIMTSAQWAPTSHNVQAYTIISITDPDLRSSLEEVCGPQWYVGAAPVFLVFVADFHKHAMISEEYGTPFEMEETENVLVGAVDAALAAQNAFITAKSYGLGGVMIGGIRNHPQDVGQLLNLPLWTFPVMGMCLGYPDDHPGQKPRLPLSGIWHENGYQNERVQEALTEYEKTSLTYYQNRSSNPKAQSWSEQMASYLSQARRPQLTTYLKNQGFTLK